jgi:hypothetical protein
MSALTKMAKQFYPYAQEYLGFDKPATIVYQSDSDNAQNPLGKTAHYQPDNYTITLYVDGRHPKDLLRSLAHELVHHTQNCRGDLSPEKIGETGDGYAQTDGHLRKMEQEAYASMVMRDWEDQHKSKRRNNLNETIYSNKEYTTMSEHEKLVKAIVAEVMKATAKDDADINEASDEEDAEVKEEGKYKRDDDSTSSREDAQQACAKKGKEWNTAKARCDPAKKEEGVAPDVSQHRNAGKTTDEADETVEEAYAGAKSPDPRQPKTGKKCYDAKGNQVECGSDKAVKEGKDEDDDETTDDLQETFQRRNVLLYERLVKRWSK